jgi:predicted RND superfamily exporter protein
MLYGNIVAKKGGLMDDSLLNEDDPFYKMDKKAEALVPKGLKTADVITFVISFPSGLTVQELTFIKDFTGEVKAAFPEFGILSISCVPRYRDNGEELLNNPYVTDEIIKGMARDKASVEQWKADVAEDPTVYGLLIGRNFDYAAVAVLLPRGFDEIGVFRRIAEFLEQKKIPIYWWYFKTDIHPAEKYKNVTVGGWTAARGLMDAALLSDTFKLSAVGILIVGLAFYLSLRSKKQALIAVLVILVCFAWTRGSIGLLQKLGFHVYERVYFLFVYTCIIVSGISFAAHKFESYNEVRKEHVQWTPDQAWKQAGLLVNGMIWVTGVIAIVNFAGLYQIGIRGILEVGLFSALGIMYLLFLVFLFLPALQMLMGAEAPGNNANRNYRTTLWWDRLLQTIPCWCYNLLDPCPERAFEHRKRAQAAIKLSLAVAGFAAVIVALDYIPGFTKDFQFLKIMSRPMDYLPGTIVHRASEILNKDGSYGFDRISIMALPKNGGGIYDYDFISKADRLRRGIGSVPDIREVNSVLDTLKVIGRESYKTDLPQSSSEIHDALQMVEWDLGPQVKEQLWFDEGLVLMASFAANDSNKAGGMLQSIVELAEKQFPDLEVFPFGKTAIFPQVDKYIREGKPLNVFSSQWMVIVICALWIILRNHRTVRNQARSLELMGWRTGFAVGVPLLFASGVVVLVMVVLRVPLDQATACITALTINAAIDFSLYLVADYHSALLSGKDLRGALRYALPERGKVIVMDIVLNALCFAPLMMSRFVPVARMGWVMIVMLVTCGFGSLVLLPAILPWCVKQRN